MNEVNVFAVNKNENKSLGEIVNYCLCRLVNLHLLVLE